MRKEAKERVAEVSEMYGQLRKLDIEPSAASTPELAAFFVAANAFVRDGTPSEGEIRLPQLRRRLEWRFLPVSGRPSRACLRSTAPKG